MKPPEVPRPDQDKLPPKLSRLEEARRLGRRTALIYVKTSSEALIYVNASSDQRRKSVGRWCGRPCAMGNVGHARPNYRDTHVRWKHLSRFPCRDVREAFDLSQRARQAKANSFQNGGQAGNGEKP